MVCSNHPAAVEIVDAGVLERQFGLSIGNLQEPIPVLIDSVEGKARTREP